MTALLIVIVGCVVVIAYCVFMASILPRLRSSWWVARSGVEIGPYYSQRAAERAASRRGGQVVKR